MNQGFPPSRRRGKNPQQQEFAPVNVVMALIGQSRRRCVTISEMIEKQAMGLVQLKMECQQMAGLLRQDPQGLNRLAISLHAAAVQLEKNKEHLQEQIQVELFLQGELQRWVNGEPPSDFAPPPPGMIRHQMSPGTPPPQLQMRDDARDDFDERVPPMRHPIHGPPSQPQMQAGQAPQRMPPQRQQHAAPAGNPLLPPQAAFAAYRAHTSLPGPSPEAAAAASREAASHRMPQADQHPLTRMPVVRLPVEQFRAGDPSSSSASTSANGPSATSPPMTLVKNDDDSKDNSSTSS